MIELFRDPHYDFIGKRSWAYAVSIAMTLIGVASLFVYGLRFDVDFTGGALVQIRFERPPAVGTIRAALSPIGLEESIIQQFGDPHEYILRFAQTAVGSEAEAKRVEAALAASPSLGPFEIRRAEYVLPASGARSPVASGLRGDPESGRDSWLHRGSL
jgi:preprotein translocase subunit SecF